MGISNDQTEAFRSLVYAFLCLVCLIMIDPLVLWALLLWSGVSVSILLVGFAWLFVVGNAGLLAYMLRDQDKPTPTTIRRIGGRIT